MSKKRILISLVNKTYKEMDMSDITTIQDDMFSGRDDIEKVELPEGVEIIKRNAFEGCNHLTEVVLPSTIKVIDYEAFANCVNLKTINIPEGIEIDGTAFNNCTSLKK